MRRIGAFVAGFACLAGLAHAEDQGWLEFAGKVSLKVEDRAEIWLDYDEGDGSGVYVVTWEVRKAVLAADGSFHFRKLRPGLYTIHVKGERHAHWRKHWFMLAEPKKDFRLELPLSGMVEGKVTTLYSESARTPRLRVYRPDGEWIADPKVAPDGTFRLTHLVPGTYHLHVTHERRKQEWVRRVVPVTVKAGVQKLEAVVAPDERVFLSIALPEGVEEAHGSLLFPGSPGKGPVRWKAWAATEGKAVVFEVLDHTYVPRHLRDRRDRFNKGSLALRFPKGRHRVRLEAIGFESEERMVEVEGETRLRFTLKPLAGQYLKVDLRAVWYAVEARSAKGNEPWRRLLWKDARARISHQKTPGESVGFLPQGRYRARVRSLNYVEAHLGPFDVKGDRSLRVLEFDLKPGASVGGRVFGPGRLPLEQGEMHILRREGPRYVRLPFKFTGIEEGQYRVAGLAPGRYRFAYTKEGTPVLGEVEVGNENVEQDLVFPR